MITTFRLTVDPDPRAPSITVENLSAEGLPATQLPLLADAELPYHLAIDQSAGARDALVLGLREPFDPQVTRDANILQIETSLSDCSFGTWDDTRYLLHVRNTSQYYLAEDIHIAVALDASHLQTLPDGNAPLSLTPGEQHIRCLDPGQTRELTFAAISRGPAPRLYPVEITVRYRLLYWDGRRARDVSRHLLPVQGAGGSLDCPPSPARMPRQPSSPRSHAMQTDRPSPFLAPLSSKPRPQRHLRPIEQHIPLPGGGQLGVAYRLIKGPHRDAERSGCSYGHNPESNEIESYFSTQDTAALELTLHNESAHSLKHVFLTGVQLTSVNDDRSLGEAVVGTLPDGNLFFEIVPDDIYFGKLSPNEKEIKFLSLITRGVKEGHYAVRFKVHYDIEQCQVPVDLWLTVRRD